MAYAFVGSNPTPCTIRRAALAHGKPARKNDPEFIEGPNKLINARYPTPPIYILIKACTEHAGADKVFLPSKNVRYTTPCTKQEPSTMLGFCLV